MVNSAELTSKLDEINNSYLKHVLNNPHKQESFYLEKGIGCQMSLLNSESLDLLSQRQSVPYGPILFKKPEDKDIQRIKQKLRIH
jgi:hypothetical protein